MDYRLSLFQKLLDQNAFWSYEEPTYDNISDEFLIEKVIVHLDIDDINMLFVIFPEEKIREVWHKKIKSQDPYYHGLNHLMSWLYFGDESMKK